MEDDDDKFEWTNGVGRRAGPRRSDDRRGTGQGETRRDTRCAKGSACTTRCSGGAARDAPCCTPRRAAYCSAARRATAGRKTPSRKTASPKAANVGTPYRPPVGAARCEAARRGTAARASRRSPV